ncbi:D-glycero-beta-D-manno-heptose 1,7-bisphosphate 7-phosphatase [Geotalea toluenoxydans]|uniref:D-glycero-beta-D-manno-heptose 1,7-bisphosphate 7-phosphatase n=1 Tax=Geotalea toluenoxydans TaxID=421624 RepID=UPI0006D040B1|nr:D-glycero-beta-D-manno-heptose 1,7-bisphosphate 7-phosphatase [Geotalea toluenoxydans]
MTGTKRAVFLDRDGTINVEKEYLYRIEDFQMIPDAPEAIRLLNEAGFLVVVVTNQSGIGRGYYDELKLEKLHCHMEKELAKAGARIDAWYFCPHHPKHGTGHYRKECACRKPLPGMLLQAAKDLDIDLAASFMVGDKLADIEAGLAAGCRPLLVRTGYGQAEEQLLPHNIKAFDDIMAASLVIIEGMPPLPIDISV